MSTMYNFGFLDGYVQKEAGDVSVEKTTGPVAEHEVELGADSISEKATQAQTSSSVTFGGGSVMDVIRSIMRK